MQQFAEYKTYEFHPDLAVFPVKIAVCQQAHSLEISVKKRGPIRARSSYWWVSVRDGKVSIRVEMLRKYSTIVAYTGLTENFID